MRRCGRSGATSRAGSRTSSRIGNASRGSCTSTCGEPGSADEDIEEVANNPPQIVHEAIEHVSEQRLGRYLEEATELAFERLREYLPPR